MISIAHSRANSTMSHVFCFFLLVLAAGFFFFLDLLNDYLSLDQNRDSFYPDLLPILIFFSLIIGAFVGLIFSALRRPRNSRLICYLLFITCACTSLWFRPTVFFLADQAFLWANETHFRAKINATNASHPAIIVHIRSSVNFHKLIIYSTSGPLPEGVLSLNAIDKLGTELMGLRGCKIDSRSLRNDFYALRTYC